MPKKSGKSWKSSHYTVVAVTRDEAFFSFFITLKLKIHQSILLFTVEGWHIATSSSKYITRLWKIFLASGWVCSTRGTATTSESSSTVKANAIRLQKAQYVLSVVAHSGSKWLKPARNKLTWCDFTSCFSQVSANSHNFRFRSYRALLIQNLSNRSRHKYDPSISRIFSI